MSGEIIEPKFEVDPSVRDQVIGEFIAENPGMFNLVIGWQNGGVHIRGCNQTTYVYANHSQPCEKLQPYVRFLTEEIKSRLPVSGSEFSSSTAESY